MDDLGLEYTVHNGDGIEVQPVAPETNEVEPHFVLDGHLGRLAFHLRMLGLDCLYDNEYEDNELVNISAEEKRILLTRDRRLLMHKVITQGTLLRSLQFDRTALRSGAPVWTGTLGQTISTLHALQSSIGIRWKGDGSGGA